MFKKLLVLMAVAGVFSAALVPAVVDAKGGSSSTLEVRVTGYVTAIDYTNGTITIGQSYYGNGSLKVDDNTKISLDTVNCSFYNLELGDWAEARYDWYSKVATKISCTSP